MMMKGAKKVMKGTKVIVGLNVLPDEILINILSRLIFKEAVITSVFSKRWRYLFHFTSGNLEFDFFDISRWNNDGVEFERYLNQILHSHKGPSIDKLFIRVPAMPSYPPVDQWISFATQKKVKVLQLDLSRINSYVLNMEKLLFLSATSSPGKFICYLKSVHLVNVDVNDELMEYIISHALRIENISLKLSQHVGNLKFVGLSSIKSVTLHRCSLLKSLKVDCPSLISLKVWKCSELKILEVFAERMNSFKYNGPKLGRHFKDVHLPSKVKVEIHLGGYYCKRILRRPFENNMDHVSWLGNFENLNLHVHPRFISEFMWPNGVCFWSRTPSPFLNLKHLEFHVKSYTRQSLDFIQQLAAGCRFLSSLVIKLCYLWTRRTDDTLLLERSMGLLECLKDVKIINFAGLRVDYFLARRLLECSIRLDKMVIRVRASPITSISDARAKAIQLRHYANKRDSKLIIL